MSSIPAIPAPKPITVPAIADRIFDLWTIINVNIDNDGADGKPVTYAVRVALNRQKPDGTWERHPDNITRVMAIDDLWTLASQDAEVYDVMSRFMACNARLLIQRGVLS